MRWGLSAYWNIFWLLFKCTVSTGDSCSPWQSPAQPHPLDCSRYYYCYHGQWSIQRCPMTYWFDSYRRQCVPMLMAKCADNQQQQQHHGARPRLPGFTSTDTQNIKWSLEPSPSQDRSTRAVSKTRVSWTTHYINHEPTHMVITFYQSDGPSFKFTKPGSLPPDTDMIKWVRENADKYEKQLIPYVEEDGPSQPSVTVHHATPPPTMTTSPYLPPTPPTVYQTRPPPTYATQTRPPPTYATQTRPPPTYATQTRPPSTYATQTRPPTTNPTVKPKPPPTRPSKPPTQEPDEEETDGDDLLPRKCGAIFKNLIEFKIVKGTESPIEENPWQVALLEDVDRSHLCGGSIITNRHIVTAAHCFWNKKTRSWRTPNEMVVRVGDYDKNVRDESEIDYYIEELYKHTKYSMQHRRNDIALITITQVMTFTAQIYPICVPEEDDADTYEAGRECVISGWGETKSESSSRYLRSALIDIVDQNTCVDIFPDNITKGMFCAGDVLNGGVDTCQGDSGGPLACKQRNKEYLYGITSWGIGCGEKGKPGVYTKVAKYRRWILSKLELSSWKLKSAAEKEEDVL